jgi:hypothetical protein
VSTRYFPLNSKLGAVRSIKDWRLTIENFAGLALEVNPVFDRKHVRYPEGGEAHSSSGSNTID